MNTNKFKFENLFLIFMLTIIFIIFITAHASATTAENVKVVQTSGNIKINERIQFNGFSVKLHELHNDTVTLAIYNNDNFVELFKFYENESRQYEDIWVEVFKIEDSSVLTAISMENIRTVWTELEPAKGFWGDYIQRDRYGIEIVSFNDNSVKLGIFADGDELVVEAYSQGTENVYLDDFKIYVEQK